MTGDSSVSWFLFRFDGLMTVGGEISSTFLIPDELLIILPFSIAVDSRSLREHAERETQGGGMCVSRTPGARSTRNARV